LSSTPMSTITGPSVTDAPVQLFPMRRYTIHITQQMGKDRLGATTRLTPGRSTRRSTSTSSGTATSFVRDAGSPEALRG
jgi:hypothetical protein